MMERGEDIIEKLKLEYGLKGEVSQIHLSQLESAWNLKESSETAMRNDANKTYVDKLDGQVYSLPYGFLENRFGELKEHPGVKNLNIALNQITTLIKQLNLTSEKSSKKEEKPTTGMGKMRALKEKRNQA